MIIIIANDEILPSETQRDLENGISNLVVGCMFSRGDSGRTAVLVVNSLHQLLKKNNNNKRRLK